MEQIRAYVQKQVPLNAQTLVVSYNKNIKWCPSNGIVTKVLTTALFTFLVGTWLPEIRHVFEDISK